MSDEPVATAARRAWDWRKAWGGWTLATDHGEHGRLFHAYDVNDSAACDPPIGLARSYEPVNEGSHLCPDCMTIVRSGSTSMPTDPPATAAHFTLHADGPELFLACSCGWTTRYADGVIFGQVGYDATTHNRQTHREGTGITTEPARSVRRD